MGYIGYSMSENAARAYDNGEKPKSKWTKTAILEAPENYEEDYELCHMAKKYTANKPVK